MNSVLSGKSAVLLDRHRLWLSGLEGLLRRLGVEVLAATDDPGLAVEAAAAADLLVAECPQVNGAPDVDAVERALAENPELIVVCVGPLEEAAAARALEAGARAYLAREAHPEDIVVALRQLYRPTLHLAGPRAAPDRSPAPEQAAATLTRRELEILRYAADGASNAQIARALWVTEQTVKFHLSNVYRKLGVRNRTEASRRAHEQGLLGGEVASW
ncbi:MAG TPA: response regulator transcription factor [Gaiellaceae bacterium]|nr:response regulator transcription factor [Gaiellaceae bacterium]